MIGNLLRTIRHGGKEDAFCFQAFLQLRSFDEKKYQVEREPREKKHIKDVKKMVILFICLLQGFLGIKWARWKRVLFTRSIAITPTLFVARFEGIQHLTGMNDFLNVLQSLQVCYELPANSAITSIRNSRRSNAVQIGGWRWGMFQCDG